MRWKSRGRLFLGILGALLPALGSAHAQTKLPVVQAIFEEAAELAELLPPPRRLVFIGRDARLIFEALSILSAEDSLSPEEFALQGRIHWVSQVADVSKLSGLEKDGYVQILSSTEARQNGIQGDCDSTREETKIWVLNVSADDKDCVHENFLENSDRAWPSARIEELHEFASDPKKVKFYALKRRVWRHLFLMVKTDKVADAAEVLKAMAQDPTGNPAQKSANVEMIRDFREIVRRYFSWRLNSLDNFLETNCEKALEN